MRSNSARVFSVASESGCSDGGAVRMLRDLAITIDKFWSRWDLWAGLWKTSSAAETSAQICGTLQEVLKPLHQLCGKRDVIVSQKWRLGFYNHKVSGLSCSSFIQLHDLLNRNMVYIIYLSLYIYIWR